MDAQEGRARKRGMPGLNDEAAPSPPLEHHPHAHDLHMTGDQARFTLAETLSSFLATVVKPLLELGGQQRSQEQLPP